MRTREIIVPFAILVVAVFIALVLYIFPSYSKGAEPDTATSCGGTVIAGLNCQAGEPVPYDCAPTELAYERAPKNHTCISNGWGWYGSTGYCVSDPVCASCTPNAACAANTCSTSSCSDSCGNVYAGTQNCSPPPTTCADIGQVGTYPACSAAPPAYTQSTYAPPYTQSTYAPGYSQSGYYSQSTYAPVGCGTPAATLTAAPTRVRSGQTSTLTLTATGVTTSCSITGPGVNTTVAASSCGVSKTLVTPAITSQVTYRVTCDSTVDIAKIIVNLVPKVIEF